jgi:hypothetical protein
MDTVDVKLQVKLLSRLAASAPSEIPYWFKSEYEKNITYPSLPDSTFVKDLTESQQETFKYVMERHTNPSAESFFDAIKVRKVEPINSVDANLIIAFFQNYLVYLKRQASINKELDEERYFAWRVFYARRLFDEIMLDLVPDSCKE